MAANSPYVYGKVPIDSAANVPVNTQVNALFNKTMNESTISTQTFTLKNEKSGSYVDATVKMEGANAILKPLKPLDPSTKYIATIARDVKDIEGNPMTSDVTWSFTTESSG